MAFRALLLAYVLGGLTFVPLLIAAIVIPAWYLLPRAASAELTAHEQQEQQEQHADNNKGKERAEEKAASLGKLSGDAAASGTYAVLRRYDFQAALTALDGRQNSSAGVKGGSGGEGLTGTESAGGTAAESVYQSVYRSVFVGSKSTSSTTSLLQDPDGDSSLSRRKLPPANLLYIVLRHGHLMLYDSPAQVEVKHVLSLAHHEVSLQAGPHNEGLCEESQILEADLFTKRTAIVLTPVELPQGAMQAAAPTSAKPFYLFAASNIDKEDFYHALLSNRVRPPTPRALDPDALIKLQSSLHSSSLTAESRAIDALIGRLFLALHRVPSLSGFVRAKLEKKLNRIQKPAFIPSLLVQSINLGDAGPVFSNLRLRDLNIDGEMTLAADVKYNGRLSVTLLAVAKLDLGTRFKVRTVDLALKTIVQRISGTMLLRIKPPPSNRIWFCFENVPELDVRVEPVVSERKITYGFVLRAIEERLRTAFKEGLVKPNWDDIPMPFSDTVGTCARGGLWSDPGAPDVHAQLRPDDTLAKRNENSISLPDLVPDLADGASTGVDAHPTLNTAKVRHSSTMPPELSSDRSPRPPRPLRTPSVSSSPITAVDGQNVEPVRGDDASLRAQPSRKLWRPKGSTEIPVQKDALAGLRELQSRAEQLTAPTAAELDGQISARSSQEGACRSYPTSVADEDCSASGQFNDPSSTTGSGTPTPSTRSTVSIQSTAASSESDVQSQSRKAYILAATVNATTAAKNWSWNALQRNRGGISRPEKRQDVGAQQPIGRGMPLPPPGQPLPGPQKGIWGGAGALRRRAVPSTGTPPKPSEQQSRSKGNAQAVVQRVSSSASEEALSATEEEFQPWQENSGLSQPNVHDVPISESGSDTMPSRQVGIHDATTAESGKPSNVAAYGSHLSLADDDLRSRKIPPPLPARPNQILPVNKANSSRRQSRSRAFSTSTSDSPDAGIATAPALRIPETEVSAVANEISKTKSSGRLSSLQPSPTSHDILAANHPVVTAETKNNGYFASERLDAHVHMTEGSSSKAAPQLNPVESGTRIGGEHDETAAKRSKGDYELSQDVRPDRESDYKALLANGRSEEAKQLLVKEGDDEALATVLLKMRERAPAAGTDNSTAAQHKSSDSVGFSDGWPGH